MRDKLGRSGVGKVKVREGEGEGKGEGKDGGIVYLRNCDRSCFFPCHSFPIAGNGFFSFSSKEGIKSWH